MATCYYYFADYKKPRYMHPSQDELENYFPFVFDFPFHISRQCMVLSRAIKVADFSSAVWPDNTDAILYSLEMMWIKYLNVQNSSYLCRCKMCHGSCAFTWLRGLRLAAFSHKRTQSCCKRLLESGCTIFVGSGRSATLWHHNETACSVSVKNSCFYSVFH
jgi:hypothetical protein